MFLQIISPITLSAAALLMLNSGSATPTEQEYEIRCSGTKPQVLHCLTQATEKLSNIADEPAAPDNNPAIPEKPKTDVRPAPVHPVQLNRTQPIKVEPNQSLITPESINYLKGVDPELVDKLNKKFKKD